MYEIEVVLSPTLPVASALTAFIESVDALAETFPLTQKAISSSIADIYSKLADNLVNLIGEYIEAHDIDAPSKFRDFISKRDKSSSRGIDAGKLSEVFYTLFSDTEWMKDAPQRLPSVIDYFEKNTGKMKKLILADKLIQQGFVISLIGQFDIFLSKLMRALFLMRPEVLNGSEKNISFSQLQNFGTLDDAREFIIKKEIENIMRESHTSQIEWLEKHYHVKLMQEISSWGKFVEVTERRNLFVHTGGIISDQYIGVCRKHGVLFAADIQLGRELGVSSDYFREAHECVLETGIKIAHLLWRKAHPKTLEEADNNLIDICYRLLTADRYDLASSILDFSVEKVAKHFSDENRRIFIVNRSQAYKWKGETEKAKSIMAEVDWSASKDSFRLAEAVIINDFDRANRLVKKLGVNGDITASDYREWPLFKEYRKDEGFLNIFEEIFGEPLYKERSENLFTTIDWVQPH